VLDRDAAMVAVPVHPGDDGVTLSKAADEVAARLDLDLAAHLARDKAKGEPGEAWLLPTYGRISAETVLVYGAGAADKSTPAVSRRVGAVVARRASKVESVAAAVAEGGDAAAFAEGVLLGSYQLDSKKEDPKPAVLARVDVVVRKAAKSLQAEVDRARVRATATSLARDLANEPSLDKTPAWLADRVRKIGKAAGVTVTVMEPAELAERGFGGILAVGAGSTRPPRLIRLDYRPAGKTRGHVVLIGKGITFDSGGLSIKPNEGMAAMKTDMAAGAAVIGVLQALPSTGIPWRVTGLVPAAENMPSGTSMRPGDVIRHYGGRTVEVLNTDAEGRLVLADALAHAVDDLEPDYVVDLATLTGAVGIALGKRTAALYANDETLAAGLLTAAEAAGERLWRMPLVEDYRADLDSPVADMKNIGGRFSGGSITAALFLREFVGGKPWAHLDIASAARSDADDDEISKGGTGYGVRTLLTWLESL
jgi:leucyl aminopeptidase